ncbi:hypothetical protein GCM10009821_28250 [Aeromicrobium halocynthiae]|uniref:WXG100 family type VII secretion target n=2 Tax=Aeromicrobium halocynthiae TaxID=560557 RepID=A0ABN2W6M7_9ACTN
MPMNDFDNYADLYNGVTAAQIRAAAEEPAANARVIADIATELDADADAVTGATEGEITSGTRANAQTVQQSAVALSQAGTYGVAALDEFAGHVEAFDTKVAELNQRLRTNVASAQRLAGQAAAENDDDPPEYAETWAAIRASLVPEYNSAVSTLDDNAEATASRFEQGPTLANVKDLVLAGLIPYTIASSTWPNLTLTADERRQALENEVANMTPAEQVAWVRANADVDPAIADVISPEAQEIFAGDVADDIADPRSIDADTVRLLDLFKEQEAFTTALYETVSLEDMSDAIRYLSTAATSGIMMMGDESSRSDIELYNGFMNAAGVALATYSTNVASPTDLADRFVDAITTGDPERFHQSAALTLLLREGGEQPAGVFDAQFMDRLATDVLAWERSFGGEPVWGPRDTANLMDPDVVWDERTGMFSGRPAGDGLANILAAMGNSPEAAQAFFQDGEGRIDSSILDYLIGVEDGDDVSARTFSAMNGSDEGDGLGEALEAASVGGGDPEFAAAFTTDVFSRIAELSGHDPTSGHDTGWHVWENMTDSLGAMAAGYTPDVYDLLRNSPPSSEHPLAITPEQMAKVLGEIGHTDNKDGLTLLTSAMMLEVNQRTDAFLDNLDGPPTLDSLMNSGFQGLQTQHGNVMGSLLNYGLAVSAEGDELQRQQQEIMSRSLDVVAGFVPGGRLALGPEAQQLLVMGYDVAKSQLLTELKGNLAATPTTDGYLDQATGSIEDKLTYGAMSVLYQNGYVGPQELDGSSASFDGIADVLLVGDPPQIRPDLYDTDGYIITDDTLSAAQVQAIQEEWGNFTNASGAYERVVELTQSEAFITSFIHPELRAGR